MIGFFKEYASPLAIATPILIPVKDPGPVVTAILSTSFIVYPDKSNRESTAFIMTFEWFTFTYKFISPIIPVLSSYKATLPIFVAVSIAKINILQHLLLFCRISHITQFYFTSFISMIE